jgi:ferredoxin-NADP reductase
MKLNDFKGLRKKATVRLVRKQQFEDNQYVFEFGAGGIVWKPGEHGIFSMPNRKVTGKKWRAFSVASIPEEGVIRIATKITDKSSSFKQHLKNLEKDDEIAVRGPFGWFYRLDERMPIVMVAMGVGITPVMAMVREHDLADASMYVIYAAPVQHLFRDMLDSAARKNPSITISYVSSHKEADELLNIQLAKYGHSAHYYLSGAPAAVKTLKKRVKRAGVSGSKIISDSYLGY